MRQLVIHGGIHRTGTSSLQVFLANNRDALEAAGYCYPGDGPHHQRWAWDILTGRKSAAEFRAFLAATDAPVVLLSAEDFCIHTDLSWLSPLLAEFERVEAHFVLRRQDDWLMSWYNQHIRWPFEPAKSTLSPMAFLGTIGDYHWLDFERVGDRWASVLGGENVHMHLFGPDISRQMCERLVPGAAFDLEISRQNDSIAPEFIEILRHLDLISLRPGQKTRIVQAISKLRPKDRSRNIYPPSVLAMINERFEESNRAAFAKYVRTDAEGFPARADLGAPFREVRLPDSETLLRDYIAPLLKHLA